jgi:5-formyltetrahydrofolate cyclo-ligase
MAAPATIPSERRLIPIALESFDDLTISSFGVREPKLTEGIPVDSIDVVLLPGVAFDKQGFRLGYGGGYYDRFLPLLSPHTITIGVAYELQLLQQVPTEAHDIPLDLIVTESQILNCRELRQKEGLE